MNWPFKIFSENKRLRARVQEYETGMEAIERVLARERMQRDTAGAFVNRETVVKAILDRYHGKALYGNMLVKRIVNLLAAYQLGQGLKLIMVPPRASGPEVESKVDKKARGQVTDEKGQQKLKKETQDLEKVYADELAFAQDFMDANNLSEERTQELAREKEFCGQILLLLYWDEAERMVRIRFIAWDETRYKVVRDVLGNILYAEWFDSNGKKVCKEPEEFVFMRWNGRLNGTEGSPTLAGSLWLCDDIEKGLKDLRLGNHFFGYPTPVIEVEDEEKAESVNEQMQKTKWNLGQSIAVSGKATMLETSGSAGEMLIKEVTIKLQFLSGSTGVNPHFLGFPDLMDNRATAEDMENPVISVAKADSMVWIGGFEELLAKATAMYDRNMRLARELVPGVVMVIIITSTQTEFREVKDIWLPARLAREISRKTFLSKFPGIKVDEEIAALEEEEAGRMAPAQNSEDISARVERMRQERMNAETES